MEADSRKVDYDKLADNYDKHRRGAGPYLERLVALAAARGAAHVLEVGAGTGNNTQAFLDAYPCRLIALEPSRGMIDKGVTKQIRAHWLRASGLHIPIADRAVGFVYGVYVLHYIPDLDALFAECARVLDAGVAAFVTASRAFIDSHPMNRYFPSFAKIDRARFQPVDALAAALKRAGLADIGVERFVAEPQPIGPEYVRKVAGKFISTYSLLPPDEYAEGLRRLEADVAERGRLDVDVVWESVAVWGRQ